MSNLNLVVNSLTRVLKWVQQDACKPRGVYRKTAFGYSQVLSLCSQIIGQCASIVDSEQMADFENLGNVSNESNSHIPPQAFSVPPVVYPYCGYPGYPVVGFPGACQVVPPGSPVGGYDYPQMSDVSQRLDRLEDMILSLVSGELDTNVCGDDIGGEGEAEGEVCSSETESSCTKNPEPVVNKPEEYNPEEHKPEKKKQTPKEARKIYLRNTRQWLCDFPDSNGLIDNLESCDEGNRESIVKAVECANNLIDSPRRYGSELAVTTFGNFGKTFSKIMDESPDQQYVMSAFLTQMKLRRKTLWSRRKPVTRYNLNLSCESFLTILRKMSDNSYYYDDDKVLAMYGLIADWFDSRFVLGKMTPSEGPRFNYKQVPSILACFVLRFVISWRKEDEDGGKDLQSLYRSIKKWNVQAENAFVEYGTPRILTKKYILKNDISLEDLNCAYNVWIQLCKDFGKAARELGFDYRLIPEVFQDKMRSMHIETKIGYTYDWAGDYNTEYTYHTILKERV